MGDKKLLEEVLNELRLIRILLIVNLGSKPDTPRYKALAAASKKLQERMQEGASVEDLYNVLRNEDLSGCLVGMRK